MSDSEPAAREVRQPRPGAPSLKYWRELTGVFLVGALLALTFQVVIQLIRTLVALPRARGTRWPLPDNRPAAGGRAGAPSPVSPSPTALPAEPVERRAIHAGAFAAWHYPPFAIYFVGLLAGVTGFFMYFTASGWLALQLTNSAAGVSALFTVSSLPMLVLTLFGGALADRVNRRLLVMVTRLMLASATGLLGLLAFTGVLTIPLFVALSLALGVIWAFDLPTRQALVADLVPAPAMANAYAWQSVLQFVGSTVGPVAAGMIVLRAGPGAALLIGAAGHVIVSVTLLFVRTTQRRTTTRESIARRVVGGLGYLKRSEPVLLLMVLATVPALTVWGIMPLLPIVARDVLHGDAGTYGLLTGATGVGSIVGAVFVAVTHRWPFKGWMAVLGTIASAAFLVGVAYTQDLRVALALLLFMGAASGVAATLEAALVQVLTPPEFQGRVASIYMMTWNFQPLGVLTFGALGEIYGVPFAIWAAGLAMAALTLVLAAVRPALRQLRA